MLDFQTDACHTVTVERFGDMFECAFHGRHQFAITPVGAHGEVRDVVFSGVEEVAFAGWWKTGRGETGADNAEEEMVVYDGVAGLVGPVAFGVAVFVSAGEGVWSDAVRGRVAVAAKGELYKCEGEVAAVG